MAIQAFSGGIQQLPTPDFNLTENIADGDLLVYKTATKSFDNFASSFTTLAQVNTLIANIQSGGGVDLSGYVLSTALATQVAALNTAISVKADTTYVDAQIAGIVHPTTDLSNYVTAAALSGSLANYDLSTEVTSKINTAVANASYFSGSYLDLIDTPTIPSLNGYATQLWVQNQIATTDVGDLTDVNSLLGGGGATTLGALTDVSTSGATAGHVLKYNGTSWVPATDDTAGGSGGEANVQPNWTQTVITDDSYILNKPTIPTDISNLTDTTNLLTHTDIASLTADVVTNTTNIAAATTDRALIRTEFATADSTATTDRALIRTEFATADSTATTDRALIRTEFATADAAITASMPADVSDLTDTTNLLTGAAYTDASVNTHLNTSVAGNNEVLSWTGTDYAWVTNSGGGGGATSLGGLSDVSSTAPTNGQVLKWDNANSTWAPALDSTTGIGGSSYATEAYVDQSIVAIGAHWPGDYLQLTNLPNLFSGSFPDLNNKPTTIAGYGITDSPDSLLDLSISDGTVGQVLTTDGAGNFSFTSAGSFSGDYNALSNLPNLFSGNYNDLQNKPYIPSIAGLASTSYVDSKHAEAEILGDKSFINNISQVAKVSNVVLASHDNYVMSIETTDATPTEALLTTGNRVVIADNSTVMYSVHIVGADGTDNYGIKLQGIIDKTTGTLALIGTPSKETLADSTNGTWVAGVTADSGTSSLKILVTGEAGKTVNWTIFVEQNVVKR